MFDYTEEDDIQRKELKRLIDSTTDPSRKAALERSLGELNNRNVIGNDTILTSNFSSSNLMRSENGTGSSSNLLGKSTPMARPGSASIRQRRPSITLDKIPESLNENRPSSKKVAGAGSSGSGSEENSPRSMSSPHEDRGDGFKVGSGGTSSSSSSRNAQIMTISSSADERMLNINISEPNCDCTDIVASCYYSPITPAYIPFREDASRAMSKEQAKAHVQQYSNSKGNLLRWVCTGLTPQILELPLVESFRVNRVHIQCYGEVEEMTMHLTETGTTGLSGHITSLDCPRNLTAGDNSSFSIDVLEQIDASSHILNSPSDVCNKISFTITKSAAIFFGIHKLTIHGTPMP